MAARALLLAADYERKAGARGLKQAADGIVDRLPSKIRLSFAGPLDELTRFAEPALESVVGSYAGTRLEDALAECLLEDEDAATLKRRGAVFTPSWLARRVSSNAANWWRRLHNDAAPPQTVADLSCGAGAFLAACADVFDDQTEVVGLDIHERSVEYAHLLRAAYRRNWNLACADSLAYYSPQSTLFQDQVVGGRNNFDILIGNPPYVRAANLQPSYAQFLREHYESMARGNFDLSVAFIENAIENLSDGGIFSYVVSSKFCQSAYGKAICRKLSADVRVLSIEYFGDHQLFKGYTTYVMVLTAAKTKAAKRFTLTTFPTGLIAGSDPGSGDSISLPTDKLKAVPWDFASGGKHSAMALLQSSSHPMLNDVFGGIFQGLRTGANDVFVVPADSSQSLEPGALLPFVTGRQIGRFSIDRSTLKLIFPYSINAFGDVRALRESDLRSIYPAVWQHLSANKHVLQERSREGAAAWYAFSRSQNLAGHRVRKLLVKEMMARVEFAADLTGEIAFGSGYALDASRIPVDDLLLWTAVLNTPTMEFALRHAGTQLHSGWFRLLKHHLRRVHLPALSSSGKQEALELAAKLHELAGDSAQKIYLSRLDDLVAEGFGISPKERALISGFLADCHKRSMKEEESSTQQSSSTATNEAAVDRFEPVKLERYNALHRDRSDLQRHVTFKDSKKLPIHRWYPYTQGFSATLVETLVKELGILAGNQVLDPFAGSGTTSVVCSSLGIPSIAVDISPLMTWVTRIKVANFRVPQLQQAIEAFDYEASVNAPTVPLQPPAIFADYFQDAFSERILRQIMSLSVYIEGLQVSVATRDFLKLGLIGLLEEISNIRKHGSHYRFLNKSESIGLRKLNIQIVSSLADIGPLLKRRHLDMLSDLASFHRPSPAVDTKVVTGDARALKLGSNSVDFVITSPPYLNRNNYIAQQKAELSILGFVQTYADYKKLVRSTFRSHVESALDKDPLSEFAEVNLILEKIALSPGNNPKIPHMISGYFGDLALTLRELFRIVVTGGSLAFVVGNTRWGGVVIPIDHILLMLAERVGFRPERVLVTRLKGNSPQQMRMYGRIPVRESVVIFRKP
jgi:methylase of polypeptide subunit release factors